MKYAQIDLRFLEFTVEIDVWIRSHGQEDCKDRPAFRFFPSIGKCESVSAGNMQKVLSQFIQAETFLQVMGKSQNKFCFNEQLI